MKPDGALKLVSELLDLPLIDSDGRYCGIVDDVELSGSAGKELKLKALLVGPGAYAGRLPRWALASGRLVAGAGLRENLAPGLLGRTEYPHHRVAGIGVQLGGA